MTNRNNFKTPLSYNNEKTPLSEQDWDVLSDIEEEEEAEFEKLKKLMATLSVILVVAGIFSIFIAGKWAADVNAKYVKSETPSVSYSVSIENSSIVEPDEKDNTGDNTGSNTESNTESGSRETANP